MKIMSHLTICLSVNFKSVSVGERYKNIYIKLVI